MATKTKECAGAPRYGLPKHDQDVSKFGKNKAQKDGLARVCQECWPKYMRRLEQAAGSSWPPRWLAKVTQQNLAKLAKGKVLQAAKAKGHDSAQGARRRAAPAVDAQS